MSHPSPIPKGRKTPRPQDSSIQAFIALILACALLAAPASACDICAVYTATQMQETRTGWRAGVAEQLTFFDTLQRDGREVPNPNRERLESSITQLLVGYSPHPRFVFQTNVPIISRHYRRVEAGGVTRGDESGLGDISLLGTGQIWARVDEHSVLRFSGLLGVKLPTGNPKRLSEELVQPGDGHEDPNIPPIFRSLRLYPRHSNGGTRPASGVHGHDLALGTGSADVLLGLQALATWERWYGTGSLLYTVRTPGAYGYQYANELIAQAGPGYYVLLEHSYTLGLQAQLTSTSKGTDDLNDVRLGDTGYTGLYAGPAVQLTWTSAFSADLIVDLPAYQNNTALQIVPDFRLRGGLVWRF
jgi:hypothetical protein